MLKRVLILLLSLFGLALLRPAMAQQRDSSAQALANLRLQRYQIQQYSFDTTLYQKPDTALQDVWQYDPALRFRQHAYLGVLGSAARRLWVDGGQFAPFQFGYQQYQVYQFDPRQREYWNVSQPLTDFEFTSGGGNNQQHFRLLHTQNIGKTVNIGGEYRLLSTDGFYLDQGMSNRNLSLFGSMTAPRKRYALHVNYTTNNNQNEQNGGIGPGRILEQGQFFAPLSVPVNLRGARSRYNQRHFYAEQLFRLSGSDSTQPGIAAFHRLHYQRDYYRYNHNQPNAPYYPAAPLNPNLTDDSTAMRSLQNSLGLRSLDLLGNWHWELALNHQAATLRTDTLQTQQQQLLWLSGQTRYQLLRRLHLLAEGQWVLLNALQSSTYRALAKLDWQFRDGQNLQFGYLDQTHTPGWVSQRFVGNHQQQFNNFAPMREQLVFLKWQLPIIDLVVSQRQLTNFLYYDANGQAQQYANRVNLLQLGYTARWRWKKLQLDLQHGWQWGAEGPVRAPRFYSSDALSFRHDFKAGWTLQLGTEMRFQSAYLAPGFRPEIGQFVVQDSLQAGGAPVFDLFAAIKVKRTRIFVKFEHANQGFPAPNIYLVPLYPLYERAFRFGITWAFYN
jgi:hypothetical protein